MVGLVITGGLWLDLELDLILMLGLRLGWEKVMSDIFNAKGRARFTAEVKVSIRVGARVEDEIRVIRQAWALARGYWGSSLGPQAVGGAV